MKTVVITGAGKGIGFQTVNNLLGKQSVNIIAVSRNCDQLKKINNPALTVIQADLTNEMDVVIGKIGNTKIDALLNNAGLLIKNDFQKLTWNDFESVFKTNTYVPFELTRRLVDNFNTGAHILNIGSMGGVENTSKFPGMLFYSSSKAALHCLTQSMSVELSNKNVRSNCLALGAVETEMVKIAFPGFQPPINAQTMAEFVAWFLLNGHNFMNGQIIPLELKSI